jgi:hypothetical protein
MHEEAVTPTRGMRLISCRFLVILLAYGDVGVTLRTLVVSQSEAGRFLPPEEAGDD